MPPLSIVVCVYQERELLIRLLQQATGCYDDLVVVHDGSDTTNVREMVVAAGGRFFERPREFQQEPHWPFAWGEAKYDWILRLDADEFPGEAMQAWLKNFRQSPEPTADICGYTCIWPMWDGQCEVTKKISPGRIFLFHKQRVRFFGMVEQVPVADGHYQAIDFILHHQPKRKSYGLYNVLVRKQAYRWRERIATSLLGKPTDLPCWRWDDTAWPLGWEQIRQRPLWTAVKRLVKGTLQGLRDQWYLEKKLLPLAAMANPIHHSLICLKYWQLRRNQSIDR
jgi:hypothetical protein